MKKRVLKKGAAASEGRKAASVKKKVKTKRSVFISFEGKAENAILRVLHRVSTNARRKASRNNASVTIIRDGKIIKISPNKREKILGRVTKEPLRIDTSRPIKIK